MTEYDANSHRSKEGGPTGDQKDADPGEKKTVKVIQGKAVVKKKNVFRRSKEMFFAADFGTVVDFIIGDVILPALRDAMVDTAARGTERLVYGEARRERRPRPTSYSSRIQYNNYRSDPRGSTVSANSYPANLPDQRRLSVMRRDVPEVVVPTRADAEAVVEMMLNYLDKYGVVALSELYEMLGRETGPIDLKWGWTLLRNVPIRQVRDGYQIDLPPMEEL
jgi:hypothetical protein